MITRVPVLDQHVIYVYFTFKYLEALQEEFEIPTNVELVVPSQ